ncbi:MAG: PPE family protein [Mycobacterium sp.]
MDFGLNPPEVNSARMYCGPGAGPMLAAATAWAGLAAELELSADCWRSILTELATTWTGPSVTAMTAAATPYVAWMHGAAELAGQTAAQAQAAVAAYDAAFAMTVPPPVVAANRSQLLVLIATNFFGQNTPAIAANEAAYAMMWAQDATAMYGYAGAAATATVLRPFTPPPQTTNPIGSVEEAAEVGRGVGTSAANTVQQVLTKLSSSLPATAAPATDMLAPAAVLAPIPPLAELPTNAVIELGLIPLHLGLSLFGAVVIDGLGVVAIDLPGAIGATVLRDMLAEAGIPFPWIGSPAPGSVPVLASMGQAIPLSGLSVPSSWASATGTDRPVTASSPAVAARADATVVPDTFSPGLAGMAGLRALAGLDRDQRGSVAGGTRRLMATRAPCVPEVDIATELRELMDLHGTGVLTDAEFAKEKERLFAE